MCLCGGYGCSNCDPSFYDNDAAQDTKKSAQHIPQHVKPKIVSVVAEEYYDRIEKQCDC